jgi:hypothetical protein
VRSQVRPGAPTHLLTSKGHERLAPPPSLVVPHPPPPPSPLTHSLRSSCHRRLPPLRAPQGPQGDAHRRSNTRTEPSADTVANTPGPPQAMSYTSRSWAISWVSTSPFWGGNRKQAIDDGDGETHSVPCLAYPRRWTSSYWTLTGPHVRYGHVFSFGCTACLPSCQRRSLAPPRSKCPPGCTTRLNAVPPAGCTYAACPLHWWTGGQDVIRTGWPPSPPTPATPRLAPHTAGVVGSRLFRPAPRPPCRSHPPPPPLNPPPRMPVRHPVAHLISPFTP